MAHTGRKFYAKLLSGAAMLSLSAFATAAHAEKTQYSIPPQPLDQALRAFNAQSGHPLLVDMALVKTKKSHGVDLSGDPETVLQHLLEGTGLSYRRDGDVFAIVAAQVKPVSVQPRSVVSIDAAETVTGSAIEGLVVTAQKRRENIQDVPIAISAFTQDKLEVSQIAGGPDLITQVPNMTFTKTNFSGYSIQIRGIGTQAISATTDPAVSVSHNNTAFIRNRFFEQEFYDLERVEVLRGPQGTLYGRNATAGVVNLITAKPSFDYETKVSLDLGNYQSRRVEAMANLPLTEDKAALRFAGAWTDRDGYAENSITGQPIDGRNLWSTRLSLRLSPTDNIDANLIWEHFEEEDDRLRSGKQLCKTDVVNGVKMIGGVLVGNSLSEEGGQGGGSDDGLLDFAGPSARFSQGCARASLYAPESFQTPQGLALPYYAPLGAIFLPTALHDPYVSRSQSQDLRVIESTVDPQYHAASDIGELQISFDLSDNLTVTSETAYAHDSVFSQQDFNRFNTAPGAWDMEGWVPGSLAYRDGVLTQGAFGGIFCDPQIGCSDRLVAVDLSTAESRTFSQEFRLSSSYDGSFNFSAGANFLRYDTEDKYYVFINSLSLISAISPYGTVFTRPPYVNGESDNRECLKSGQPGVPGAVYPVANCTYIDPNPIGNLNDQGHNYFLSKNPYKLISYAAFGEAYWNITEDLKVTAGLRVTMDKKEAPRIPSWTLASDSAGYPVAEVVKLEWTEPTGRLAVDWKPDLAFTDETLLYASLARGYKAGGANPPNMTYVYYAAADTAASASQISATRPKTFDAEFVNALELGAKNTFLDGALTMNLAGFYYDYKGYQISEIVDRSAFNRNFDATVWGLEFEGDWQALENLRFGLKVGYEKTRIANGERAVDLMDRTAGDPNWVLVKPFPTFASNCILPTSVVIGTATTAGTPTDPYIIMPGGISGGNGGACELAYLEGLDPVTRLPYVPNPTAVSPEISTDPLFPYSLLRRPGYAGFNPFDASQGHNYGEGIFKDLSGNELPNAPNFTTTLTVDYTLPLGTEWNVTLHGDFYWQSDSWWRVFNDHEYNRLDEYHTINLAAILRNDDSGWSIMAYVKNATDETAITGAFLNSDDTGLTTNVFLTEPRLYGVRVNKNWSGIPFWKSQGDEASAHEPGTPYLFTLELDGQVQNQDAPTEALTPSYGAAFAPAANAFTPAQNNDLDWGDGREAKLTIQPGGGPWKASLSARYGRADGGVRLRKEDVVERICGFPEGSAFCDPEYQDGKYYDRAVVPELHWSNAAVTNREEHNFVDFAVSRDVGLGGFSHAAIGLGLRYAQFKSRTILETDGSPDIDLEAGFAYAADVGARHRYEAEMDAQRQFEGEGPILSWEASHRLMGDDVSHADLDWAVNGGVLFGRQKTTITGEEEANYYAGVAGVKYFFGSWVPPETTTVTPISISRTHDVTSPTFGGSLGLSYTLDRVKLGAGYHWERYYNVLDGGDDAHQDVDRTIDGPYFKVAVGFGG